MRAAVVLLVAPADSPEATYLLNELRDMAVFTWVSTPGDALRLLRDTASLPDVIVTYEPRPGVFDGLRSAAGHPGGARPTLPETVLEWIYEVAPLVPRVTVCGAWGEGETRTGRIRRGEIRLEFGESLVALRSELPKLVDGSSLWRLPLTASDEEFFQLTIPGTSLSPSSANSLSVGTFAGDLSPFRERTGGECEGGDVFLWEQDRGLRILLEDLVRRAGLTPVVLMPGEKTPEGVNEKSFGEARSYGRPGAEPDGKPTVGPDTESGAKPGVGVGSRTAVRNSGRTFLIGDMDDPEFSSWLEGRMSREESPRIPWRTLLLVAFPRYDRIVRSLAPEVTILPKPFRTEDLLRFLTRSSSIADDIPTR
ncbi:MAG: hypothetical protein Q4C47_01590 [Planctomycetia bacterium]|nr:hypothetical protein [Planctomycetia bacterium]